MYQSLRMKLQELNDEYRHQIYAVLVGQHIFDNVLESVQRERGHFRREQTLYICGVRVINFTGFVEQSEWIAVGYGLEPLTKGAL